MRIEGRDDSLIDPERQRIAELARVAAERGAQAAREARAAEVELDELDLAVATEITRRVRDSMHAWLDPTLRRVDEAIESARVAAARDAARDRRLDEHLADLTRRVDIGLREMSAEVARTAADTARAALSEHEHVVVASLQDVAERVSAVEANVAETQRAGNEELHAVRRATDAAVLALRQDVADLAGQMTAALCRVEGDVRAVVDSATQAATEAAQEVVESVVEALEAAIADVRHDLRALDAPAGGVVELVALSDDARAAASALAERLFQDHAEALTTEASRRLAEHARAVEGQLAAGLSELRGIAVETAAVAVEERLTAVVEDLKLAVIEAASEAARSGDGDVRPPTHRTGVVAPPLRRTMAEAVNLAVDVLVDGVESGGVDDVLAAHEIAVLQEQLARLQSRVHDHRGP